MTQAISVRPMRLIGIEAIGPSSFADESGTGAGFGAELWFRFIDILTSQRVPFPVDMYGVSWPADTHVPPQQIHYFCGLESDVDVEGLHELRVAGGNYFEYRCEVPASDLDAGFRDAYLTAMPASGLVPRDGQHLEVYGEEYDPNAPIARFRILIPVV